MITLSGESIRRTDPHRHKFADAMSEYLYDLLLQGGEDEWTGSVESVTGHVARFGRRLLFEDGRGFVMCDTYPEVRGAVQVFEAIQLLDAAWSDGLEPA